MNPRHLFEALSPLFVASVFLGTSPIYSQQLNGKHYLKTSNGLKLITVMYLLFYTCSVIYGMTSADLKSSVTYFGNAMSIIGIVLDSIGQILLIYTIYIFSFIVPKSMRNIFDKLAVIDSVLTDLGHKNNYKITFWQQVFLLFAGLSSIVFAIVAQFYSLSHQFHLSEAMWFVYYFPIIVIFVMICQFTFTVFLISQRFITINDILNQMANNAQPNNHEQGTIFVTSNQLKDNLTPSILRKVETLMQVHDSIVDAANELNTNYSFQILVCLTVLFIKSVFAIFFSYFELFALGKPFHTVNWSIWVLIDAFEIILITAACHWASTQAQQTGVEVHKLLMNSQENIIRDKLIIFSQQVFHRPVDFTACGLFSINAELIFTILGSATTYLLIMLQFQEDGQANCIIANATVQ